MRCARASTTSRCGGMANRWGGGACASKAPMRSRASRPTSSRGSGWTSRALRPRSASRWQARRAPESRPCTRPQAHDTTRARSHCTSRSRKPCWRRGTLPSTRRSLDAGITAFRLAYGATLLRSQARGAQPFHQGSLRFDAGMNAGAWRLRHRSTHLWRPARARESDTLSAHLERDVSRFDARLTLGDFNATGLLFDPVALRGVRFQSDDRMLPASQLRNAPTIRGVADTNARVQVRQARAVAVRYDGAARAVRARGRASARARRRSRGPHRGSRWSRPVLPRALRRDAGVAARRAKAVRACRGPVARHGRVGRARGRGRIGSRRARSRHVARRRAGDCRPRAGLGRRRVRFARRCACRSIACMRAHRANGPCARREPRARPSRRRLAAARTTLQISASHMPASFHALQHAVHSPGPRRERQRFDATLHKTFGDRRHGLRLSLVDRRFHDMRGNQRSAQLGWSMPAGRNGADVARHDRSHARRSPRRATHHAVLSLTVPLRIGNAASFVHAHARAGAGPFRPAIRHGRRLQRSTRLELRLRARRRRRAAARRPRVLRSPTPAARATSTRA